LHYEREGKKKKDKISSEVAGTRELREREHYRSTDERWASHFLRFGFDRVHLRAAGRPGCRCEGVKVEKWGIKAEELRKHRPGTRR
jgi:hypothetical protein